MIVGSVCSGIGAPEVASKSCAACREVKPLTDFFKQKGGHKGRHSYCKSCYKKRVRVRPNKPHLRRAGNLRRRYGLDPAGVDALLAKQGGLCPVCEKPPKKMCVDHDHSTGKVRGVLCRGCNVMIGILEDPHRLPRALAYLKRGA